MGKHKKKNQWRRPFDEGDRSSTPRSSSHPSEGENRVEDEEDDDVFWTVTSEDKEIDLDAYADFPLLPFRSAFISRVCFIFLGNFLIFDSSFLIYAASLSKIMTNSLNSSR